MVDCGTKLIFLTTPGVRKYLKQMYKNETVYAVIERALKVRNRVVFLLQTFLHPRSYNKLQEVTTSYNKINKN